MNKHAKARRRGLTFIELVLSLFVLSMISMAAVPMVEHSTRRARELELRAVLRSMRGSIDSYYADAAKADPKSDEAHRYPRSLEELVAKRYLRTIPIDPMTGTRDWAVLSTPAAAKNVFDVRSNTEKASPQGIPYGSW